VNDKTAVKLFAVVLLQDNVCHIVPLAIVFSFF